MVKNGKKIWDIICSVISIIFAIVVIINIPWKIFEQTKVIIDYNLKQEEEGSIQVFYAEDGTDFSEVNSITETVSAETSDRISFKIPKKDIVNLRIDIDDISQIRFDKIKITGIGCYNVIKADGLEQYVADTNLMEVICSKEGIECTSMGDDSFLSLELQGRDESAQSLYKTAILIAFGTGLSIFCFFLLKLLRKIAGCRKDLLLMGLISVAATACLLACFAAPVKISITYNLGGMEYGTVKIYYAEKAGEITEENSMGRAITIGSPTTINFTLPVYKLEELRIDFDDIKSIDIEQIKITGLGYRHIISSDNLEECMTYSKEISINADKEKIRCVSEGNDPLFIMSVKRQNQVEKYAAGIGCLAVLSSICFLVIYGIRKWFLAYRTDEKLMKEKQLVFIQYAAVVLALAGVCAAEYSTINEILSREKSEYKVNIGDADFIPVTSERVTIDLINHGKKILYQCIMVKKDSKVQGGLHYSVLDENGRLLAKGEIDAESVIHRYNSEYDEISLEFADVSLQLGEAYSLIIDFDLDSPLYLIGNAKGEWQTRQLTEFAHKALYIAIVLVFGICAVLLLGIFMKKGFTDKLFLATALTTGCITCFLLVPYGMDDEYRHFLRAYDLTDKDVAAELDEYDYEAKGNVTGENEEGLYAYIMAPVELDRMRLLDKSFNFDDRSDKSEKNSNGCIDELLRVWKNPESGEVRSSYAATYSASAIPYLPQILFIFLGRLFGMRPMLLFYMARLGNMIFCSVLAYLSVRLIPKYRNYIFVIYFAPHISKLRASCNRDNMAIALVLLFVAYILYIRDNKLDVMKPGRLLILQVMLIGITITKMPVALVVGLLLLLRKDNFPRMEEVWKRLMIQFGLMACMMLVSIAGYVLTTGNDDEQNADLEVQETADTTSMSHLQYLIEYPKETAEIFLNELSGIVEKHEKAVNGYNYQMGYLYIIIGAILLLLNKKIFNKWEKIYVFLLCFGIWMLILWVAFTWMPPTYGSIWGVGPRYLFAIIPMLWACVCCGNADTDAFVAKAGSSLITGLAFMDIITMTTVYW